MSRNITFDMRGLEELNSELFMKIMNQIGGQH